MRVVRLSPEYMAPVPVDADPDEDLDMPLIPASLEHVTAFLYGSAKDAEIDRNFLAMGFFLGMPSEARKGYLHVYMVTNAHVVKGMKWIFARIHFHDETSTRRQFSYHLEILQIAVRDFTVDRANDLAIVRTPLPRGSSVVYESPANLISDFRLRDSRDIPFVGMGDDIMMVSRVVRRGMRYTKENLHVARFGNVALVPRHEEFFFLVEMRSIAGHSGSPVWVILPGINDPGWHICGTKMRSRHFGMKLLGINRGHLRDYEEIITFDPSGKIKPHNRWIAQTNMAISQVVPAWLILDLLYSKGLCDQRTQIDDITPIGADIVEDSIRPTRKKLKILRSKTSKFADLLKHDRA